MERNLLFDRFNSDYLYFSNQIYLTIIRSLFQVGTGVLVRIVGLTLNTILYIFCIRMSYTKIAYNNY